MVGWETQTPDARFRNRLSAYPNQDVSQQCEVFPFDPSGGKTRYFTSRPALIHPGIRPPPALPSWSAGRQGNRARRRELVRAGVQARISQELLTETKTLPL